MQDVRRGSRALTATVALVLAASSIAIGLCAADAGATGVTPGAHGWARVAPPADQRGVALHGLACHGTTCLAIGQRCAASTCPLSSPQVALASRDLGGAWRSARVPRRFQFAFEAVSCTAASACEVGGTLDPGTPDPRAALATTTDLGRTWVTHLVTGLGRMVTSSCPSARVCFAVGFSNPPVSQVEFGQVARSLDGGRRWATTLFPTTGVVNGIACATPSICTAYGTSLDGGHSILLQTSNAGASWSERSLPVSLGLLRWLTCPTVVDCMGVSNRPLGRVGSLDMTGDLGERWATRSIGHVDVLYFAACQTPTHCTFVGQGRDAPLEATTTDGGDRWSLVSLPAFAPGRLWSLACGTRRCVAVGQWWRRAPGDGGPLLLARGPRRG